MQFVFFAISTGNAISFSSYMLKAATLDAKNGSWLNRGISVAAISVVCLIHAFLPRLGIWLSNGLGAFKLVLLLLVVCTGFAALAGRAATPSPRNFSSFSGPGSATETHERLEGQAAGHALALLQILYSYSGWENANYVLTEVRDAPRTLRKAAPLACAAITLLYVLANIAYVSLPSPAPDDHLTN